MCIITSLQFDIGMYCVPTPVFAEPIFIFKFLLILCCMKHKGINMLWYCHYWRSSVCCNAETLQKIVASFNILEVYLHMEKMTSHTTQKIRGTHHLSKICCARIVGSYYSMWTGWSPFLCNTKSMSSCQLGCELYWFDIYTEVFEFCLKYKYTMSVNEFYCSHSCYLSLQTHKFLFPVSAWFLLHPGL